jgi:hypothetical protein
MLNDNPENWLKIYNSDPKSPEHFIFDITSVNTKNGKTCKSWAVSSSAELAEKVFKEQNPNFKITNIKKRL